MEREGGGGAGGGREKCVLCTDESQQAKTILYAVVCSSINKSTIPHLYTCVYMYQPDNTEGALLWNGDVDSADREHLHTLAPELALDPRV